MGKVNVFVTDGRTEGRQTDECGGQFIQISSLLLFESVQSFSKLLCVITRQNDFVPASIGYT